MIIHYFQTVICIQRLSIPPCDGRDEAANRPQKSEGESDIKIFFFFDLPYTPGEESRQSRCGFAALSSFFVA